MTRLPRPRSVGYAPAETPRHGASDVRLPGINGIEARRNYKLAPTLPVLLITATPIYAAVVAEKRGRRLSGQTDDLDELEAVAADRLGRSGPG